LANWRGYFLTNTYARLASHRFHAGRFSSATRSSLRNGAASASVSGGLWRNNSTTSTSRQKWSMQCQQHVLLQRLAPLPGGAAVQHIEKSLRRKTLGDRRRSRGAPQRAAVFSQRSAAPGIRLAADQVRRFGPDLLHGGRRHAQQHAGFGGRVEHGFEPGGLLLHQGQRIQGRGHGFQVESGGGRGSGQFLHDFLAQLGHEPALRRRFQRLKQAGFRVADGRQHPLQRGLVHGPAGLVVRQQFANHRDVTGNEVPPAFGAPGPAIADHFIAGINHGGSLRSYPRTGRLRTRQRRAARRRLAQAAPRE
jgi:hypothetical protein